VEAAAGEKGGGRKRRWEEKEVGGKGGGRCEGEISGRNVPTVVFCYSCAAPPAESRRLVQLQPQLMERNFTVDVYDKTMNIVLVFVTAASVHKSSFCHCKTLFYVGIDVVKCAFYWIIDIQSIAQSCYRLVSLRRSPPTELTGCKLHRAPALISLHPGNALSV
jgi:hypothetical protein